MRIAVVLCLLMLLVLPAHAEDAQQLFTSGKADAMKVSLLQVKDGAETPVQADHVFSAGDHIRVQLESNFSGYVYILNLTPGGETRVLLPSTTQPGNAVGSHTSVALPPSPANITFDTEKGIETLRVVMSRQKLSAYESAAAAGGVLEEDPLASTEQRARRDHLGVVEVEQVHRLKLACRGLFISKSEGQQPAAYVAITPGTSGARHLEGQDVAVFEIRLKHD